MSVDAKPSAQSQERVAVVGADPDATQPPIHSSPCFATTTKEPRKEPSKDKDAKPRKSSLLGLNLNLNLGSLVTSLLSPLRNSPEKSPVSPILSASLSKANALPPLPVLALDRDSSASTTWGPLISLNQNTCCPDHGEYDSGPSTYLDLLVISYCQKRGFYALRPLNEADMSGASFTFPNGIITNMNPEKASLVCFGNDPVLFEQLLNRGSIPNEPLTDLESLIVQEQFIPIVESNPTSLFRIFQLSQMDMTLLDVMINKNGFKVSKVNDEVLRRVVACNSYPTTQTTTPNNQQTLPPPQKPNCPSLREYLQRGFKLSPNLVKSMLLDSANSNCEAVVKTLADHISSSLLRKCAREIVKEMMGPSGTIPFSSTLVSQLLIMNILTLNDIQRALIGTTFTTNSMTVDDRIPYTTRCYEQTQPYKIWHWVLETFGATHVLTQYCFDDLLQWLGDLGSRGVTVGKSGSRHMAGHCSGWSRDAGSGTYGGSASLGYNPFNSHVAPFVEGGVTVLPRHLQFLAKAAKCKASAPMPALVMTLAFQSVVQRGVERAAAATAATVSVQEQDGRMTRKDIPYLQPPLFHHHRRGTSRDSFVSTLNPEQQQQNLDLNALTQDQKPASVVRNVMWWGDNIKTTTATSGPSPLACMTPKPPKLSPVSDMSPSSSSPQSPNSLLPYIQEVHLWIDAIKSLFLDVQTIHAIKHADGEWFKEYKCEMEAQDRKDLMSIGIPMKKSWSGGGLSKRQSEFGSGWWDMLIGVGGGGGMAGRIKALGTRSVGRPGRFLELAQEMLRKLELIVAAKKETSEIMPSAIFLILVAWLQCASSLKILIASEFGSRSHVVPFFEVSRLLNERGHKILYASFEENLKYTSDHPFVETKTLGASDIPAEVSNKVTANLVSNPAGYQGLSSLVPILEMEVQNYPNRTRTFTKLFEQVEPDLILCDFFARACMDSAAMSGFKFGIVGVVGFKGFQGDWFLPSSLNPVNQHDWMTNPWFRLATTLDLIRHVVPTMVPIEKQLSKIKKDVWGERVVPDALKIFSENLFLSHRFHGLAPARKLSPNVLALGPLLAPYKLNTTGNENLVALLDSVTASNSRLVYIAFGSFASEFEGIAKRLFEGVNSVLSVYPDVQVLWACADSYCQNVVTDSVDREHQQRIHVH
ncbi:UNVERIFIED_CONTAM: hypothetical protein HDU68_010609, partial [Siphonaria sp. JEL0065]